MNHSQAYANAELVGGAHPTECCLMVDAAAPGAWNMGVDEALLMEAAEGGVATLRFYGWSEPTLSLGYFQRYDDRYQHAASRECAVVRRQTGGGAILHDRELTYSITLPPSHPLARQSERIYSAVHKAFIAVLMPRVVASAPHLSLMLRCDPPGQAAAEPFLCFERRAPGDVVVGKEQADWKILGSAQRRHRGAVLQHGSLLLERSPAAPELAGLCDLSGIELATAEVAAAVQGPLAEALGLRIVELPWTAQLQSKAEELANDKYGAATWTKRR